MEVAGENILLGLPCKKSGRVDGIYFYPGNGATSRLGKNIDFKNYQEFVEFCNHTENWVGDNCPEAPLVDGFSRYVKRKWYFGFWSKSKAAQLEGSKAYMKEFAKRYGIPTAQFIQTPRL